MQNSESPDPYNKRPVIILMQNSESPDPYNKRPVIIKDPVSINTSHVFVEQPISINCPEAGLCLKNVSWVPTTIKKCLKNLKVLVIIYNAGKTVILT